MNATRIICRKPFSLPRSLGKIYPLPITKASFSRRKDIYLKEQAVIFHVHMIASQIIDEILLPKFSYRKYFVGIYPDVREVFVQVRLTFFPRPEGPLGNLRIQCDPFDARFISHEIQVGGMRRNCLLVIDRIRETEDDYQLDCEGAYVDMVKDEIRYLLEKHPGFKEDLNAWVRTVGPEGKGINVYINSPIFPNK